jgi:hypothetical protein
MNPSLPRISSSICFPIEQEIVERILDELWKTDAPLLLNRSPGAKSEDTGVEVS